MSGFTIGDNIIDSRDVIARIEELTAERDALQDALDEATALLQEATGDAKRLDDLSDLDSDVIDAEKALADWDDENSGEYAALQAACEEGEASPDWTHGATLVHDSYFTEYVMDMLADIGDLPRDIPWYIVIDHEATADNVKADYFNIDLDGETYWIRA